MGRMPKGSSICRPSSWIGLGLGLGFGLGFGLGLANPNPNPNPSPNRHLDAEQEEADQACGGHGGQVVRVGLGSGSG